jgi:CHAT domain-containing protein
MCFAFLSIAASLAISGCGSLFHSRALSLGARANYSQLVKEFEPPDRNFLKMPFSELIYLCGAYSGLKNYQNLFPCLDAAQTKVNAGEYYADLWNHSSLPLRMRATAYIELGQYEKAIEAAESSYEMVIHKKLERWDEAQTLDVLGVAYGLAGINEKAEDTIRKLKKILSSGSLGSMEDSINIALARIYISLHRYQEAINILSYKYEDVSTFAKAITGWDVFIHEKIPFEFIKNKSFFEVGRVTEAKEGYDNLLRYPFIRNLGEVYWNILFDRGRIYEREGDTKQAIEFYKQSIDVIEFQRSTINTEASKIGFVGNKQAVYQRLIAALFADDQYAVAFEYIERSKARALVDMLASKQDFAVHTANASAVHTLLAKADTAESEARMQSETADTGHQRSLAVHARQQLQQQAPELSSLVSVTPVTVQEIQGRLLADEVLVEYYAEGKEVYAFVLSKGGLQGIKLNGEGLTAEVQNFRQALQDTRSTYHRDLAGKLYNRLVRPLEGAMKERNVLIVAHGPLHYLPFNALHDGNGYLIERYSVRLLPSASVLKYLKGVGPQTAGALLAFGNPDLGDPQLDLKYAQAEAQNVAKVLPNSKALVRREASESAFKRYGEGFKYLHIASHGTFNADAPLSSALLLAKDNANDGTLTVGELYSMRLNADLVTLSACETGLGKIANGDDVVGLTRGFLYAGSRSIVASLWKVDDEATAYLMTRFYQSLKGTSKREALRLAQIETRKKYPHPYYWAAFQLTGEAN